MHKKKQRGVTLIELIVVIIVMGIIIAGSADLLLQGFKSYAVGSIYINSDWQATVAMERMSRELHSMPSQNYIATALANRIVFTDVNGSLIDYKIVGSSLMRNNQVLADYVQNMTISYFDQNGATTTVIGAIRYINIVLTIAYGNKSVSFTNAVNLWNTV